MGRAHSRTSLQRATPAPPSPLPASRTAPVQLTQIQSHSVTYHSPMPPAAELRRLERLLPGIKRFMRLTEAEALHRRAQQRGLMWLKGLNATLGVLFAGSIGLIGVGGGIYGMIAGKITDLAGAGVVFGALASLVGAYITGRRSGDRPDEPRRPPASS
jgi:hypothetical protein